MKVPYGVERSTLPSGATYIKLRHYADPLKDEKWLAETEAEMLDDPKGFRLEILMDDTIHEGESVLKNYKDSWHCFPDRAKNIPIDPNAVFYAGWDGGLAHFPALEIVQVCPHLQIHSIGELAVDQGVSMEDFAPAAAAYMQELLGDKWRMVIHVGDPTIMTRSGIDFRCAWDVMAQHGIFMEQETNAWAIRYGSMEWLLGSKMLTKDGQSIPRFVIDSKACPVLHAALSGAYQYPKTKFSGFRQAVRMPVQNMYCHPASAWGYLAVRVKDDFEKKLAGAGKNSGFKNVQSLQR